MGDPCAQKYWRGFSPRKGALGDDVFTGGWEDMKIFTQTQVRWNPASLHLAFRGNEELAFTLNITNINTQIKKKFIVSLLRPLLYIPILLYPSFVVVIQLPSCV